MSQSRDDIARTLAAAGARRRPWWLWASGLLVLALGGAVWLQSARQGASVSYLTEPVTRGPLVVTVTATGTVQPTTEVAVSSELSGTLATVEVDYNDRVAVGQVLARLDDTKLRAQLTNAEAALAASRAQVAQAEASLTEAQVNYDSQRQLDERGVGTHREFVAKQAAFDRARAALDMARADLTLAEANLTLRRADLDNAVIRSPIAGIVLDRAAEAGQIVAATLQAPTLFTLAEDLARMELRVDIDEADIGRVAVGNPAQFTVDAYPGRAFAAELVQLRFAPETTDGVVTYKGVLSVDNADLALRPGMTATATITVSQVDDALLVPNAALRFAPPQVVETERATGSGLIGMIMPARPRGNGAAGDGAARSVWALRDGAAVEVAVTPGDSDGRHTAILAGDLAAGEAVITDQTGAP
ncbi:efflux RND transporter periplasmic adaptor subunit [Phaeovulum sp. NW3]|uniref:efflux RND transporter periplasmic adaptor subunit n=1 Tax=Phaeovulum sp. NW3 TaxID=2934933 RepID=UPI0020206DFF|nr:efflux RND transporter periplasmic adaptor subunit [Phaeovulum sp. NW3]MCL7465071.1 efflux RND transporter periplasmic adaptor subunit [Phaeovulum sp. NW3]